MPLGGATIEEVVDLGERIGERQRDWRRAVAESERLADEFAQVVQQPSIEALPLV